MDRNHCSRRGFLAAVGGSVAATTAAWASGPAQPAMATGRKIALTDLSLKTFQPLIGQTFTAAHAAHGPVPIKLVLAEAAPERLTRDQSGQRILDGFNLLFEGAPDKALDQGIHEIAHPNLGTIGLFMTPIVARNPDIRCYEVIFNNLV